MEIHSASRMRARALTVAHDQLGRAALWVQSEPPPPVPDDIERPDRAESLDPALLDRIERECDVYAKRLLALGHEKRPGPRFWVLLGRGLSLISKPGARQSL